MLSVVQVCVLCSVHELVVEVILSSGELRIVEHILLLNVVLQEVIVAMEVITPHSSLHLLGSLEQKVVVWLLVMLIVLDGVVSAAVVLSASSQSLVVGLFLIIVHEVVLTVIYLLGKGVL